MRRWLIAALAVGCLGGTAEAAEPVDLELVLLADTTGSIDDAEVRFQRQGYAAALTDPAVLSAIANGYNGRIAVTFVEWADADSQAIVVPWRIIDGAESAAAFAQDLIATPRQVFGRNAIGSALAVAQGLIETNEYEGFKKVIDLSGDSANSWGGVPLPEARAATLMAGTVINGLAILCRDCNGRPVGYDLERAFAETIIGGPGSFVITADDMSSFAEAVRRKMLLEIAGPPVPPHMLVTADR